MRDDEQGLRLTVEDGVATLLIDRPKRRNSLDERTLQGITRAFRQFDRDGIRAVVIGSTDERSFCAGADIKELAEKNAEEKAYITKIGQETMQVIHDFRGLVIAAIEGFCLGGGLELALCCDHRIAGRETVIGLPEIRINGLPSWGGMTRLVREIGYSRSKDILLFDRRLTAEEAEDWGLVSKVVASGEAVPAAQALAQDLAQKTTLRTVELAKGILLNGHGADAGTARMLEYVADIYQSAAGVWSETLKKRL
nr:enoyl-CoA hydratase/isomerase family protein [Mesorhizobium sp. WSM4875]